MLNIKKETKKTQETKEKQYDRCLDARDQYGFVKLGLMSNQTWIDDPKRLVFVLSRYKFVAKMFDRFQNVLEVGCADAFGTRIVSHAVQNLTALDFDPLFIENAKANMIDNHTFTCIEHDILKSPAPGGLYDGVYTLDVLEHIAERHETQFMTNIVKSMYARGALIVGTPSLQSQHYASLPSRQGHVNCKNYDALQRLLAVYFHNVFIFSMNDEVVHTGFAPMAHYFLALCCYPKNNIPCSYDPS
jgi:2-polyprenyl-3-methyl-5-hydroxy-6-metoxy-1,4-benzoquinol methylase